MKNGPSLDCASETAQAQLARAWRERRSALLAAAGAGHMRTHAGKPLWLRGRHGDEGGADAAALGIDGHAAWGDCDEGGGNVESLQPKSTTSEIRCRIEHVTNPQRCPSTVQSDP